MKRFRLFLIGLFAAVLPSLMAPTGGFPSSPTFSKWTVSTNSAAGPSAGPIIKNSTGNLTALQFAPDNASSTAVVGASGGAGEIAAGSANGDLVMRTNAKDIRTSTDNGVSSASIAAADSGNININLNTGTSNCTVSGGTGVMVLHKVGRVVFGRVTTGVTCTIAAGFQVTTSDATVPVAFRPATQNCGAASVTTASTPVSGFMCVSSTGNIVTQENMASGSTTVTNLGPSTSMTFTYTLD